MFKILLLIVKQFVHPYYSCDKCASLKLTNPSELTIAPGYFIEFETDSHIEFTSLSWPANSTETVQGNVQRVFLNQEFSYDGPDVLTLGEVRFTSPTVPQISFMNVCNTSIARDSTQVVND